jgi:RsiW-degrading membrane proteinase PrsW (M82 family)
MSIFIRILRWTCFVLVIASLAASLLLLVGDPGKFSSLAFSVPAISAVPLFLAGASFLVAQRFAQASWAELLKNLILGAAFLLWAVIQLLPKNAMSRRLGNLVIALYVLDIAWATLGKVIPPEGS